MSDSDSPPRSPFAPLSLSCGESVGSSGSQNPGSRPRDHRSQVSCRSQGSPSRNGAQHTCGLPHLSLHGFGLPRTTPEVFDTSHRDGVQTIQPCNAFPMFFRVRTICDGEGLSERFARAREVCRWSVSKKIELENLGVVEKVRSQAKATR